MPNLSQIKRKRMLEFLGKIKEEHKNDDEMLIALGEIENELNSKKYGLVWEEHEEKVDVQMRTHIPVFTEVKEREISATPNKPYNFLLEGDNLHSLYLLEKTHKGKVDVIYIDPPYNRGKDDFVYDDQFVLKEDGFRHSKWLSFMSCRLLLAQKLLSVSGVIIINIDEHESAPLSMLLDDIFGAENNLGEIIWNKMNPKGDAQGVSAMHETIYCYAKNKAEFMNLKNVCMREKVHATLILAKAKSLYKKIGKTLIPDDIAVAIKPFEYSSETKRKFEVMYTLELANVEFQNWLNRQPFSQGEKAYKFIDENGRVYRGVSMAWPNKKRAPDDYFIPLKHPITGKDCPIPERGWRNPPATMKKLINEGLILFGVDETKQPERKYFLDENLLENTPSIYESADSSDSMLADMQLHFEYAKPVSEAKYVIRNIHPNPKIIMDFFAGSGTTAQAVLELNKEDGGSRRFILCTNNESLICDNVTYPRIKTVITGKRADGSIYSDGIPANLKYYRTDFVARDEEFLSDALLEHIAEMIQLEHGVKIDGSQYLMVMSDAEADELQKHFDEYNGVKALYISKNVLLNTQQLNTFDGVEIHIIPDDYFKFELKEEGQAW